MLTKKIKYTDYNGVEREENFLFNLSKAELMEMEMTTTGGLGEMIKNVIAAQDGGSIVKIFKELVLKAYGEKSADGKRFMKVDQDGHSLAVAFSQTEAYSNLFMELSTNATAAAEFVRGIMPADIDIDNVELPPELQTPELMDALNNTKKNTQAENNNVVPLPNNQ